MTRENTKTSRMTTLGARRNKRKLGGVGILTLTQKKVLVSADGTKHTPKKKKTTTTINSLKIKRNIYTSNQYIFKS